MSYLTYEEYQEYGGTLDEATFDDLEFQAEVQIDWYTFNRLQNDEEVNDRVKKCVYMLIKLLQAKMVASVIPMQDGSTSSESQPGIIQQSNDGVSIMYNTRSADEVLKNSQAEISNCIKMYLQGVTNNLGRKVLWRGIYPDE